MSGDEPAAGGIYVHFPYCAHHCAYCDFNVATPRRIPHERFTDALLAELALRASTLGGPARTLYLGGGTPSLWDPDELTRFVAACRLTPGLAAGAEITLEANPDDVDETRLAAWRRAGVTRISLGVQALGDGLLRAADRLHDTATALRAVELLRDAGLASWSLDFMFGLAGHTPASWEADLARISALQAPHLSVYNLTVEPRTVLARQVATGAVRLPADAAQFAMLMAGRRRLVAAGYEHYEVSSYALPGHRAVHNAAYWDMRPYLGLGPGAHGFLAPRRWSNIRRPSRYVAAALEGRLPEAAAEDLSPETLAFERVMTGLRRLDIGVDLAADWPVFGEAARIQSDAGMLHLDGTRIRLTQKGLRWMDRVLVALMPSR